MTEQILASPRAARRGSTGIWTRLLRHNGFIIGLTLLLALGAAALIGLTGWTADPLKISYATRFLPPGADFFFGTDHYGRSILARVLHGASLSLWIGGAVVGITAVAGIFIGVCAGYFPRLDGLIMRCMDALMAFPPIMLAIAIAAALGAGVSNVILALSITYAPRTARIVRAAVMGIRSSEYIESARLSGAGDLRIILRHILPNAMAPLIVDLTFVFAYAILAEAALSFLGVGPPPPTPTWGNIIAEGRDFLVDAPWITLFPGLVIAASVLALNLLGDGLRDVLDPRLRVR